jgi:hypothetical protein
MARPVKGDVVVRPNRLFTADNAIVLYRVGSLVPAKLSQVVDRVVSILRT